MSNFLKMDLVNAIQALKSKGWSKRRIARELQIDRQTVRKYLRAASNSATLSIPDAAPADSGQDHPLSTPGSDKPSDQNHPLSTLGNLEVTAAIERVYAQPSGRPSKCQTYAELIETKVQRGLTAQRIYQDLVIEVGFQAPTRPSSDSFAGSKRVLPRRSAVSRFNPRKKPRSILAAEHR